MATVVVKHHPSGGPADPTALVDGPTYDNDEHIVTGLENVDNVSDVAKPISAATQAALDLKATGSPSALTRTNDTNVTLTLGGAPTTALLHATSITLGWTGTLAAARGGFASDISGSSGVPLFTTGVATFTSTIGTGNFVRAIAPTLTGTTTLAAISGTAIATKSDQQTATSTTTVVSPSQQQSHPSSTKAWAYYSNSGTTYTNVASYNIASITRNSAGNLTVTLTTAFASAAFAVNACCDSLTLVATSFPASASTLTVKITNLAGVATDAGFSFSAFGAQ